MNALGAYTVRLFGVRASTRRRIGILAIALFAMMLGACATNPSARRIEHLFSDHLFPAREERISSDDVFAVSEEMKHFIDVEIVKEIRVKGSQLALVDALRNKGRLSLEYDSVMTRNASEAFEARSGNCLSLAIMTAAFARQLGLTVRYQSVFMDDLWSRSGDIYFSSGHVNLTLGTRLTGSRFMNDENDLMTIDFLPPEELRGQRVRVYVPVGRLLPGMAYLVRRLLENTSNQSFVRVGFLEHHDERELLMPPSAATASAKPMFGSK